ncbi:MAG: cysteine desulfurase [Planctomycetes bacterium]|nr:cysteine desulfurase [Planctomycetota bacterium]MCW8134850.1 cysteine desulfurase [Planctomycetota bacterium]
MSPKQYTYCDYAAGAPCRPEALAVYGEFATQQYANPGAHHPQAYVAKKHLWELHERMGRVLGADPREIIFTSGGTESDILALRGVMDGAKAPRNELVISAIEHHAVLLEAQRMERAGASVHYAPVTPDGVIDLAALRKLVSERTALVSVMYANNETGVIQPVNQVAKIAHAAGARYHCDAVQAFWKLPVRPREIGADLLTLAGAKFGAPKGTGLLYNEMTNRISPVIVGGPQEWGYRAGTEDLCGMAAMAVAMELAEAERERVWPAVAKLRDRLEDALLMGLGDNVRINGRNAPRLANISNISFLHIEGQAMAIELGEQGFSVGLGSACAPGETDPSHVLAAMGLSWEDAIGCIRVSFGPDITQAQVDRLAALCIGNYKRLRGLG